MTRYWSDEEVSILKETYPNFSTRYVFENYFPYRTYNSVKAKANSMKLTKSEEFIKNNPSYHRSLKALEKTGDNRGKNSSRWVERITVNCCICGKEVLITEAKYKKIKNGTTCSKECLKELRKKLNSKENNPNYNNGDAWSEEMRLKASERQANLLEKMDFKYRNTKPQIIVNEILDKNNILYKNEFRCGNYLIDNYLFDFNLMIEVQGDFYHCSPIYNKKNSREDKILKKDKNKNTYVKKKMNINILYLWEKDIIENPVLCENLIKEYIKNNGNLKNYHSFNYSFINREIILDKNIKFSY